MVRRREKLRRRKRKLYRRQKGRCFWCGCQMRFPPSGHTERPEATMATIEHLDDRFSPLRGKFSNGVERTVLACLKCNQKRGRESEQAMLARERPQQELSTNRFPRGPRARQTTRTHTRRGDRYGVSERENTLVQYN